MKKFITWAGIIFAVFLILRALAQDGASKRSAEEVVPLVQPGISAEEKLSDVMVTVGDKKISVRALFEEGKQYFEDEKNDEAIEAFTRIIDADEDSAPAYLYRAEVYFKQEKYAEAFDDYSRVIKLEPKLEEGRAYYFRAYAAYKIGKYREVIDDIDALVNLSDGDVVLTAFLVRADAYLARGEYRAAAKNYLKAAVRDLGTSENWILRMLNDFPEDMREMLVSDMSLVKAIAEEVPLQESALEQYSYVIENYYDKIEEAKEDEWRAYLLASIYGFQLVIDKFDDPYADTTKQLSAYYQAQCYKRIGDTDNYRKSLRTVLSYVPEPGSEEESPDAVAFMLDLQQQAIVELLEVTP